MIQEYRKGTWTYTNDDGKLYKTGTYLAEEGAGYRNGVWTWFDEEGKPFVKMEFFRDKRMKITAMDSGWARMGDDSVVVSYSDSPLLNIRFTEGKFQLSLQKIYPNLPVDLTKNPSENPVASRPISGIIGINAASAGQNEENQTRENIIWKDIEMLALFPALQSTVGQTSEPVTEEQNLILNSLFNPIRTENGAGRLYFHNALMKGWGIANESPDYYREFGQQFLGFRAAGINYEVIRGTLKKRLQAGKTYCFRFEVKLKSDNNYAVNHVGAVFHESMLSTVANRNQLSGLASKVRSPRGVPVSLRDSWMTIQGSFVAKGDERYVYVGQFSSRDSTRFWPLDSIFNGSTSGEIYYYFRNPVLTEKSTGSNCPCNTEDCVPDSAYTEQVESTERFILRDVQFATGSARLLQASFGVLDSLAEQLLSNPEWKLEITGHTDNQGQPEENLKLSIKRSKAVADYLAKKGVAAVRIKNEGRGDAEPIEDNETEEGRSLNRRVEFTIRR